MPTQRLMTWLPENDTDKIFTELDNQQDGTPFVLKTEGWYTNTPINGLSIISNLEPVADLIIGTDNDFMYLFPKPWGGPSEQYRFPRPTYDKATLTVREYYRTRQMLPENRQLPPFEDPIATSVDIYMTSGVAAFSSYLGPWKDEPDQTVHTIAEHSAGDRSLSITLLHSFRTTVSHRCTRRHLQFTVTYDKPACIADIQQAVLALQSLLTTLSREPLSVGSVMVNTEAGGFEYYNTSWSHLSNTERPNIPGFQEITAEAFLKIWLKAQNDRQILEVLSLLKSWFNPTPRFPEERMGYLIQALEALCPVTGVGEKGILTANIIKEWANPYMATTGSASPPPQSNVAVEVDLFAKPLNAFPNDFPNRLIEWRNHLFAHRQNLSATTADKRNESIKKLTRIYSDLSAFAYTVAMSVVLKHLGFNPEPLVSVAKHKIGDGPTQYSI